MGEPPHVAAHDVPIFDNVLRDIDFSNWDMTTQRVSSCVTWFITAANVNFIILF